MSAIAEAQRTDSTIGELLAALKLGEDKPPYYLFKGLVYKRNPKLGKVDKANGQIYLPLSLLPFALAYYHYTSHVGGKLLSRLIACDFYSPYLLHHAQKFTASCHLCVHMKPSLKRRTPLGSSPFPAGKAEEWILDFVVGLPEHDGFDSYLSCLLYTSPSPRDATLSRMPSSA